MSRILNIRICFNTNYFGPMTHNNYSNFDYGFGFVRLYMHSMSENDVTNTAETCLAVDNNQHLILSNCTADPKLQCSFKNTLYYRRISLWKSWQNTIVWLHGVIIESSMSYSTVVYLYPRTVCTEVYLYPRTVCTIVYLYPRTVHMYCSVPVSAYSMYGSSLPVSA